MLKGFMHKRRDGEAGDQSGSVLVTVMVALVCLLGAAALTVDVGQTAVLGSRAQHIADACALAGAGGAISNQRSLAVDRIQQTLEANNDGALAATWVPEEMVNYTGGQTVPNYGPIGIRDEAVTVNIRVNCPFTFARVFGLDDRVVQRQATALRSKNTEGANTLMFAICTDPTELGINISGSRGTLDGAVHSNTTVDISGSAHRFTGVIEWRHRLRITGNHSILEQGDDESVIKPDPVQMTPADLEPYDFVINGDYQTPGSGVVPPGCYRVHGNVVVTGSNSSMANVTFVADGTIRFSGSGHYYSPNALGVFAYSLSTDRFAAIDVAGAAPNSEGLLYAPVGEADFTGSDITMVSIVARTIDISGTDFHVKPCTKWGGPKYVARLIR